MLPETNVIFINIVALLLIIIILLVENTRSL